jgi:hypothetical protein
VGSDRADLGITGRARWKSSKVVGAGEDVAGEGDGDEEEVWDDMAVVEEDEGLGSDMDEEDDEESSEDEAPQKKRNGGKR